MKRLAWLLAAVLAWLAFAGFPASAAERQIARHQGLTASIDSGFGCAREASVTVRAPDENAYAGDRLTLQRLLATVRAGLSADCPTLSEIDVTGLAVGRPVFRATITAENGWALPANAGGHPSFTTTTAGDTGTLPATIESSPFPTIVTSTNSGNLPADAETPAATALRLSPLAVRTSTCDYNPNDPLVGCWVTLSPPQWRGAILNIRDAKDHNNSWFNDWPEKLADGSTRKIGTRIQRTYLPGFGPSLELVDSEAWRANRKGPFFAEECSVMRIDPAAEPLNTMLGILTGEVPEPAYFVRLRSPLRITADILKERDIGPGGLTGNPGDAEIVEGIPEDERVPAFNRCVDNFSEDGEILLDVLLIAVPITRLPALVGGRFSSRLASIARRNPAKYGGALRSLEGRFIREIKIDDKIYFQMNKRGWTSSEIYNAINNPSRTVRWRDTRAIRGGNRLDDPATAYYSRNGGYVVRNDTTGDIVQISNRNDPNWIAPWD